MDPFNIVISVKGRQIDLNLHPQEAGVYKVIYHGALVGEVFIGGNGNSWEALTAEELEPGGFPVYEYDENSGHEYIMLNHETVQAIGNAISKDQADGNSRSAGDKRDVSSGIDGSG